MRIKMMLIDTWYANSYSLYVGYTNQAPPNWLMPLKIRKARVTPKNAYIPLKTLVTYILDPSLYLLLLNYTSPRKFKT
jgi:hypothetical protein